MLSGTARSRLGCFQLVLLVERESEAKEIYITRKCFFFFTPFKIIEEKGWPMFYSCIGMHNSVL